VYYPYLPIHRNIGIGGEGYRAFNIFLQKEYRSVGLKWEYQLQSSLYNTATLPRDYSRHGLDRILLLSARQLRWSVGSGVHDYGFGLCHWSLGTSESFVVAYRPVNRLYQLPSLIREIVCTVLAKGDAWFVELAQ